MFSAVPTGLRLKEQGFHLFLSGQAFLPDSSRQANQRPIQLWSNFCLLCSNGLCEGLIGRVRDRTRNVNQ